MKTMPNWAAAFFRPLYNSLRWLRNKISRRKAVIIIESLALVFGIIFTFTSFSFLTEVSGHKLSLDPLNANFLEGESYDGPITDVFSVRHDCDHVLQANLGLFLMPNGQPHELHQPLSWLNALWRLMPWSKAKSAGDIEVELSFHNFDEALKCELLAVHVPGEIDEFSYLVEREDHGEWIEAEPTAIPEDSTKSESEIAAGAKVILPFSKYPEFKAISFIWKDGLAHLGDYDIGFKIRSGYLQNLEPSASSSVATFLTQVHTPRGYVIKSASYREDRKPQEFSHASGPVYIYRFSGLFDGTPLAVRFTRRIGQAERDSRLILWSALFGLAIGIMIEALFSILQTFALPR